MAFFSPPLFTWEEPDAYTTRNYFVKSWPQAMILQRNHLKVYEHLILRQDGKSVLSLPFNKLAECVVTLHEAPDEKPYYLLTFIPKPLGFWGFMFNFIKESALDDPLLLDQVLDYIRTKGVIIRDSRKS